jgi:hypothetical protein
MTLSAKTREAIRKISDAQQSGVLRMQQVHEQRKHERQMEQFLTHEEDPYFRSSPAALLKSEDVTLLRILPVVLHDFQKQEGPKGEKGDDGKSMTGPKGDKGDKGESMTGLPGKDGKDADISEMKTVAEREVSKEIKDHLRTYDHAQLHDQRMLGSLTLNESTIADDLFLQVKGNAIVCTKIVKEAGVPYFARGSSTTSSGGNTRVVTSVAVDTTAAAAASTDYVYFVSGTTTLTLPTAVSNTNRYTIKNTGVAIVTVAFTGSETGDGSATVSLDTANMSLDFISDGSNYFIV